VPLVALLGLQTWVVRALPLIFGLGTVALMLSLHRRIGRVGALVAGALIAVSPGAVFFSRYYIHEMPFVFFTLAAVVLWLRFAETRRSVYLMLCALSLALLFATKETAFISLGVLLIAAVMTHVYLHLINEERGLPRARRGKRGAPGKLRTLFDSFAFEVRALGGRRQLLPLIGIGVVLFIIVNVVLYSSFFTNAKGIVDSVATFAVWRETGTSDFHAKSFWTYFKWLGKEETALFLVGACGALWATWQVDNRFATFAALWAGGIVLAYSLVPYKTPWLALNFLPPLAITGGYLFQSLIYNNSRTGIDLDGGASNAIASVSPRHLALLVAFSVALAIGAYRTFKLNFVHYDDDSFTYVYAHSTRDLTTLDADVKRLVARGGVEATISIHSPDYWPLPWYFRDYKVVGYPPQQMAKATASLLILSSAQVAEAEKVLGTRYTEMGRYNLRPGVELVLFAKREIVG